MIELLLVLLVMVAAGVAGLIFAGCIYAIFNMYYEYRKMRNTLR